MGKNVEPWRCAMQEEIVAKFVWLGQKLGLVSKPKVDDDVDPLDGGGGGQGAASAAEPSQAGGGASFPPPARPVGSFNAAGAKPMMPMYAAAAGGTMYPRYGGAGTGATKVTSLKPGENSPLTKRAAAALSSASDNK